MAARVFDVENAPPPSPPRRRWCRPSQNFRSQLLGRVRGGGFGLGYTVWFFGCGIVRGVAAMKPTAAGAVEMRARHHGVDALGFVSNRDASCVILVVAETGVEIHAIYGHAVPHEDGVLRRVHQLVPLVQVVAHRALVVHLRYNAVQVGAKGVV